MEAVESFFASNPDQRGNVTYIQITPKSRSEVPEYEQLARDVNEKVGEINGSSATRPGRRSSTSPRPIRDPCSPASTGRPGSAS